MHDAEANICKLLLAQEATRNPKEVHLIDMLLDLHDEVIEGEPLDETLLRNCRYKTSTVPCFSEEYREFVEYLEQYQQCLNTRAPHAD